MPAKKYLSINSSGINQEIQATVVSAGAGNDGDIVALDASGRIDNSVMPVGIGADTATIQASEALAAGDLVNIHDVSGPRVRKADASAASAGRSVDGFVLASVASGANATVYFEGTITGLSALTVGSRYFLSGSSAGAATATRPTTSGHSVQYIGKAISATAISFEPDAPTILA